MDPATAGALITGGASLLGGLSRNRSAAKESRRNREWLERMSNTAYQRAAKDLEAAGLNRVLALGSPASTPGAAIASFANPMEGAAASGGQAMTSALARKRFDDELAQLQAGTKHTNKMIDQVDQQIKNLMLDEQAKQISNAKQAIELEVWKKAGLGQNALDDFAKLMGRKAGEVNVNVTNLLEDIQKKMEKLQ